MEQPPVGDPPERNRAQRQAIMKRNEPVPWRARLRAKPHGDGCARLEYKAGEHPYERQVQATDSLAWQPAGPHPGGEPQRRWVDSAENVAAMIDQLREADQLALDLEFDSSSALTRGSYLGRTCLMQIGTVQQVFLVDTLAEGVADALEDLNSVTTDPKILKVTRAAGAGRPAAGCARERRLSVPAARL